MDDDRVIELWPGGPPPIGDAAYSDVVQCSPAALFDMRCSATRAKVDELLKSGVDLDRLAREVRARQVKCGHKRTKLDRKNRLILCSECGESVDAFDILARIAESERTLYRDIVQRDRLRAETKNLESKADELKRSARSWKGKRDRARKATEKELALTLPERHELDAWRRFWAARERGDRPESDRLHAVLARLNEGRVVEE